MTMVINEELTVSNRRKAELLDEMAKLGFKSINETKKASQQQQDGDTDNEEDEEDNEPASVAERSKGFNYLLSMPLWSLTEEKVTKLLKEKADKESEIITLKSKTPSDLWLEDLDELEVALGEVHHQGAVSCVAVATRFAVLITFACVASWLWTV